jgi:hypothetical protein
VVRSGAVTNALRLEDAEVALCEPVGREFARNGAKVVVHYKSGPDPSECRGRMQLRISAADCTLKTCDASVFPVSAVVSDQLILNWVIRWKRTGSRAWTPRSSAGISRRN